MFKKIKQKIKDNPEETAIIAIYGTVIVGFVALTVASQKQLVAEAEAAEKDAAEKKEEFHNWAKEEAQNGNIPVKLASGGYVAVHPSQLIV